MKSVKRSFRYFLSAAFLFVLMAAFVFSASASSDFTDINASGWEYEPVTWAKDEGILDGTGGGKFSPLADVDRAMTVTALFRMSKENHYSSDSGFTDIPAGAYYARSASWAKEKGIALGNQDQLFLPEDSITREDFAVMLYRYNEYYKQTLRGTDTSVSDSPEAETLAVWHELYGFYDFEDVSDYATEALLWITDKKIILGSNKNILPQKSMSRSELAAILYRYHSTYAKSPVAVSRDDGLKSITIGDFKTGRTYTLETKELVNKFTQQAGIFAENGYTVTDCMSNDSRTAFIKFAYVDKDKNQTLTIQDNGILTPSGVLYKSLSEKNYFGEDWLGTLGVTPEVLDTDNYVVNYIEFDYYNERSVLDKYSDICHFENDIHELMNQYGYTEEAPDRGYNTRYEGGVDFISQSYLYNESFVLYPDGIEYSGTLYKSKAGKAIFDDTFLRKYSIKDSPAYIPYDNLESIDLYVTATGEEIHITKYEDMKFFSDSIVAFMKIPPSYYFGEFPPKDDCYNVTLNYKNDIIPSEKLCLTKKGVYVYNWSLLMEPYGSDEIYFGENFLMHFR